MTSLTGKVALVTGAGRGIGRTIAERLGEDGASVIVNYNQSENLAKEVVDTIVAKGGRALALQADISKLSEVRRLFQEAEDHLGQLNILINNAGIGLLRPTAEMTEEEFDSLFTLNTKGTFFALQEAARRMRDGGHIVSISTGATIAITPGFGAYAGSKAAVEQFSLALSKELGPRGITVNTVLPAIVDTGTLVLPDEVIAQLIQQTPLGRLGQPRDIADIIAFLVSDQARWITGQTLRAGGGLI
ncbi:SDR family oxidoreductase [Ktedonobacter robiniae]|uniref:3-ketoacyl-ACP reductase n=1 Tax=Ktedonobacter robiniae TaxID=2778365 RepID=A0ABQ3UIG1_9CHLR|nr:SDR family oxidoreductase [Ktedonobacter robiniae]GHO52511.1 3-ketoacyl-ACP reductase [Ktedonobacter robiniae]GHO55961.1 3-ketoacyl-ACP reductase [Ktedonobacter robiniae]